MKVGGNTSFTQIYNDLKPGLLTRDDKHIRFEGNKLYTHSSLMKSGSGAVAAQNRAIKHEDGAATIKAALDRQYGPGFGEKVFRNVGQQLGRDLNAGVLRRDLTAIAGAIHVVQAENARVGQNHAVNQGHLQHFDPAGPAFATLAGGLKPPLDPAAFSPSQRQEFTTRLDASLRAESQLDQTAVGDDRAGELAKETLKQVVSLSKAGGLDAATAARQAFTAAMKDVLSDLAADHDPAALTDRLTEALTRFQAHASAERLDEVGGGEFQELTEKALHQAMDELHAASPNLLKQAQTNALKDDSPLRALYGAAQDVVRKEGFEEGDEAATRLEAAGRLFSMATAVVSGLAGALGGVTGSPGGDVDRLDDTASVPPKLLTSAQGALQAAMRDLPVNATLTQ